MGRPRKIQVESEPIAETPIEVNVVNNDEPESSTAEVSEPIVEEATPEVIAEVVESPAKIAFRAYMEKYQKDKPLKYESKKAELEDKLNKLV